MKTCHKTICRMAMVKRFWEDVAHAMKPVVIIITNSKIYEVRFCYPKHGVSQSDAWKYRVQEILRPNVIQILKTRKWLRPFTFPAVLSFSVERKAIMTMQRKCGHHLEKMGRSCPLWCILISAAVSEMSEDRCASDVS
jgi:hypothetical protein